MPILQTRRRFLSTMALASASGVLPFRRAEAAEPPPEVTTVRFPKTFGICTAPQYVAEDLYGSGQGQNEETVEMVTRLLIDLGTYLSSDPASTQGQQ